tara:strand:- start:86 stop:484 length:399 start_codon:yes stop_codon:yes gene_type:complete
MATVAETRAANARYSASIDARQARIPRESARRLRGSNRTATRSFHRGIASEKLKVGKMRKDLVDRRARLSKYIDDMAKAAKAAQATKSRRKRRSKRTTTSSGASKGYSKAFAKALKKSKAHIASGGSRYSWN